MVNPFKTTKVPSADPIKNGVTSEQDGNRSKFDVVLLSVRRLLSRGAVTNLANLIGRLHPADSARVMMHLSSSQEQCTVFELVEGERVRGEVLSELDAETILHVLEDWNATDVAWLLRNIPDDDVAYILGVLPEVRAQEILLLMKTDESQGVAHLMTYPK
ncbi:MAG: magnesium transporter MgtE N-terminal domain-containing protein [Nitrospirales bacterium]